jgi:tetratricopeptide (TPR) repeat protein
MGRIDGTTAGRACDREATMVDASDREYMRGLRLALQGDHAGAIEALKRSLELNPGAVDPALALVDAYRDAGLFGEADALASRLRARHPGEPAVALTVARLRERQGRAADALALLDAAGAGRDSNDQAYPVRLRLLLANHRYADALHDAQPGLEMAWRMAARLAEGIALITTGRVAEGMDALDHVDTREFADLLHEWASALGPSPALREMVTALVEASARFPDRASVRDVARAFESARPGSGAGAAGGSGS